MNSFLPGVIHRMANASVLAI